MNKTVKKVFMLVGLLVVIFLAWQLIFNKGGIIRTGYNALADGVNKQWVKVAGSGSLLPTWDKTETESGNTFDINSSDSSIK